MPTITTIGTATIDIFLELTDIFYHQEAAKGRFYCLPVGAKVPIEKQEEHFGGNAANTAVGFKRLGLKTAIITSLGTSAKCDAVIRNLQTAGVDTRHVSISKGCKKGEVNLSYILDWHKDKTDRVILAYHRPKDFTKIRWPKAEWVYLTSLGADFTKVTATIPKSARVAINPGGYELDRGLPFLLPILKKTEALIVNKQEAAKLAQIHGGNDITFLLNALLKTGPKTVAITCGKQGAYAKQKDAKETFYIPSLSVNIQEVTGAGDAFASGFMTAYIKGKSLQECLRWGILNSTSCIQHIGAQNGLLTRAHLAKLYKKHYRV